MTSIFSVHYIQTEYSLWRRNEGEIMMCVSMYATSLIFSTRKLRTWSERAMEFPSTVSHRTYSNWTWTLPPKQGCGSRSEYFYGNLLIKAAAPFLSGLTSTVWFAFWSPELSYHNGSPVWGSHVPNNTGQMYVGLLIHNECRVNL